MHTLVTNKIKIDIVRQGVPPRLDAVQNDANARAVEISLLENGSEWTVPDGMSAAVSYVKPDGTSGLYDTLPNAMQAVEISGSTIQFTMAPQMLTVPGLVRASVVLIKDTEQLSTFPLDIHVTAQPGAGAEISENYYHYKTFEALNNAIGLIKELETEDKSSLVAAINEVARKGGTGTGGEVFVPKAQVTQTADGATITITDQHGTSTATITNGKDGKDGKDGAQGIQGEQGPQGEKGNTGAQGPKGDTGATGPAGNNGKDGKTPVKGTDYFTNADKAEMVNSVLAALPTWTGGSY